MGNPVFPLALKDEGFVQWWQAASAGMSEAQCWELEEQQAYEKRGGGTALMVAPDEFFSFAIMQTSPGAFVLLC